jgi:ubiquinone/menaquinone biosynthesis C-methylase UbiE
MQAKLIENHKRYTERLALYKSYGYDTLASRNFILKKSLPIAGRVLEVGTGRGYMTLTLAKAGYSFISVDVSEDEQRLAKLNMRYYDLEGKVDFRIDDAQDLNFKDNSFDAVICVCLMHHLNEPCRAVNEFLRVSKKRSKIVLADYSKKGLEIIGKIHSDEGRSHSATISGLSKIEDYLKQRGINYKKTNDKHHEILIIRP